MDGGTCRLGVTMEIHLRREIEAWAPDPALNPAHDDWFPPVFRQAPFGLAALDLDGFFVRVNAACARMHGRTIAEMEGTSALSMDNDPATEADYRATLEYGLENEAAPYENEHRIIRPDGTVAWALISGTMVTDGDDHPAYCLVQYHDTTAIHELTDEMAVSREVGDVTFQFAPLAIYSVDLEGKVLDWNPQAEELFGWTKDEVVGREIPVVPEEARDEAAEAFGDLIGGTALAPMEALLQRKDGRLLNVITSMNLVNTPDGEPHSILAFTRDISGQRRAEIDARAGMRLLRNLLGPTSEGVTTLDADGKVKFNVGAGGNGLGHSDEFLDDLDAFSLLHPDDVARAHQVFEEIRETPGARFAAILRLRNDSDEYSEYEVAAVNLLDDPDVEGIVLTTRSPTELARARALVADEARVLKLIATSADLEQTLGAVTSMVERMSHGGSAAIILLEDGRMHLSGMRPLDDAAHDITEGTRPSGLFKQALNQDGPIIIADNLTDHRLDHATGVETSTAGAESRWISPIIDVPTGERLGLLSTHYSDSTEIAPEDLEVASIASHLVAIAIGQSRTLDTLTHQAHHDDLTGLPNRVMILKRLEELVSRGSDDRLTVLFVDLDRFKVVNDSLGHMVGDGLLCEFAGRLRAAANRHDFVGRFSADEFIVLLDGRDRRPEAMALLSRLEIALHEPFIVDEGQIFLSTSTGIAESRGGEYSADELIEQASAAMVAAKKPGRGKVEVYDHRMRAAALERLELERDLRLAADRDEFVAYYQPKIDLETGMIIGAEALVRWQHPQRGLIYPNDFIPVAEETGIVIRVGRWMLERSIQQAREWRDDLDGLDGFVMAVNFSAPQMAATDLISNIGRVLLKYDWPPDQLSVELTESILIDDSEGSLEVISQLKALGVKLTIDDFGTGFSSLSYLHRFPVDVVKIDRAFVTDLEADGSGSAVAAAVMHIGEALGIVTSAEGVETQSQLQGLRELGCHWAQGYLFAKPIPADEMRRLMATNPTW